MQSSIKEFNEAKIQKCMMKSKESKIMHELKMDNKKKGKAKGAGGKARPQKQMVAIMLQKLGKSKKK